jgi:hypothetical protein
MQFVSANSNATFLTSSHVRPNSLDSNNFLWSTILSSSKNSNVVLNRPSPFWVPRTCLFLPHGIVAWATPNVLHTFSYPISSLLTASMARCISCLSQEWRPVFLWYMPTIPSSNQFYNFGCVIFVINSSVTETRVQRFSSFLNRWYCCCCYLIIHSNFTTYLHAAATIFSNYWRKTTFYPNGMEIIFTLKCCFVFKWK